MGFLRTIQGKVVVVICVVIAVSLSVVITQRYGLLLLFFSWDSSTHG